MAVGFAGATALTRVMPFDVPTFAGVAIVLLAVAALSAYLPGRGAARVDPLVALREE